MFNVQSSSSDSAVTASFRIGVHWIAATAIIVRIGISVLRFLYGAIVGAGYLFHHITIAVVARDVDCRVLQFLLDVHARSEDHLAGGDEA